MKKLNLNNIDKKIIECAIIEKYAQSELEQFKFENGNINQKLAYEHFLKNHKKDLTFYKQQKHSGYDVIVIYKGVTKIFVQDFFTSKGKEIEETLKESKNWNYKAVIDFCKAVLAENYKGSPHDKRTRYNSYKPSAEAMFNAAIDLL
jgi:hypothetical protein